MSTVEYKIQLINEANRARCLAIKITPETTMLNLKEMMLRYFSPRSIFSIIGFKMKKTMPTEVNIDYFDPSYDNINAYELFQKKQITRIIFQSIKNTAV